MKGFIMWEQQHYYLFSERLANMLFSAIGTSP